ncbi:DNA repair protein RecO [Fuchsiella alkaliacetigena]|uniref:DNA repair protein RecO n=1 Tax=Fuchsiella alkaliacetigena TaxID=957042 RepID=UPI00200A86E0|nr:DNA repair protein RecO [Fuchsiella alkaliacetigena]MCK8824473.1 DNA repair protein RecO [Fuchsiella alkaliacetigena]
MSLYQTEAIVLRHYELGEADKIAILYTKERGKVRAVAKGVRKTRSRLAGAMEVFTHNQLQLYQGKSLAKVNQVRVLKSFADLRADLWQMSYASYLAELVNELTVDQERDQALFALLLTSLNLLSKEENLMLVVRFFELRLLRLLGYQPELKCCVECDTALEELTKLKFSSQQGGVICGDCSAKDQYAMYLSKGSVAIMNRLLEIDYRHLNRLKLPVKSRQQLAKVIPNYLQSILEKPLKTLDFIRVLNAQGSN